MCCCPPVRTVCAGCGLRPSCRRTLCSGGRSRRTHTPSAPAYLATRTRSSMPWRYATVQYPPSYQQDIHVVVIYYLNITYMLPSSRVRGGDCVDQWFSNNLCPLKNMFFTTCFTSTNHFREGKYWLGSWGDLNKSGWQNKHLGASVFLADSFILIVFTQFPSTLCNPSKYSTPSFEKHRTPMRKAV